MKPLYNLSPARKMKTFSLAGGTLTIVIGFVVLFSWVFDITMLKSLLPSLASMKSNTALSFVLLGFALCLQLEAVGKARMFSFYLSGAAALLGVLNLMEYILGWNLGIDQILFRDTGLYPGRMSPVTAINFS